ncbi:LOW QUALITY PROTEIN: putative aquaporin-12A [Dugong dugon]
MAALNVSLTFFFGTFALCEAARRVCRVLEAVAAVQLGACCLELRVLVELGPWAAGLGPDLLLTLVLLLFLGHGVLDGASANPAMALQASEVSLPSTLLKLAAQALGMVAACAMVQFCWSWELSFLHVFQNLLATECSSALHTSMPHGTLMEGACAFLFHLTLLQLQHSPPTLRVPAMALLVTVLAYTAGPFTSAFFNPVLSAFFNPVLAPAVTFRCSGYTLLEYVQVYWLGPLTGMVLAVLLYQGNLPLLFQKNLFYSQKSKY